jgi:anti-anti-sigma factor
VPLAIDVVGSALVVNASGRLDFNNSVTFQEALEAIVRDAAPTIKALVVDCAALEYVSSAGLRAFLVAARAAKERDIDCCICGLMPSVHEVFTVSGFDRIVTICTDRAAAVDQFSTR